MTVGSDITPQQVREALVVLDPYGFQCKDIDSRSLAIAIEAARAWVDLYQECDGCAGKGVIQFTRVVARRPFPDSRSCTKCAGRGYVLNRERLKAAAKAACNYSWGADRWDDDVKSIWFGQAEAAVLAFLEGKQP